MFAARLTLSNQSPIRAVRQALNSLESALPRNPTWHFVKPIESTRISRISPFCTKYVSVTPVFTTPTKHAPRNPSRMNTSAKHIGATTPANPPTNSYKATYTDSDAAWSDHFAQSFAALH